MIDSNVSGRPGAWAERIPAMVFAVTSAVLFSVLWSNPSIGAEARTPSRSGWVTPTGTSDSRDEAGSALGSHSIAREWNELLLEAIRDDFARPTVHSRNLFHVSVAMFDAWAAYSDTAHPYLLGQSHHGFLTPHYPMSIPAAEADRVAAQEEALSFAAYRVLTYRFQSSPGAEESLARFDALMATLGFDSEFTSTDYDSGSPHPHAALGNYIAERVIAYGHQDNSNEAGEYANHFYRPVNDPLTPSMPGNPHLTNFNRWQPLTLDFIDQSGHHIPVSTPDFLGPEWGQVHGFALSESEKSEVRRDSFDYWTFHDPGAPPYLSEEPSAESGAYRWGFELVSAWSAQLDPNDGVMIDISPGAIGNLPALPGSWEDYPSFYDWTGGGDSSRGWETNPTTGQPYAAQIVPRGDYTRVLAEFWADGPDSETPPGHWFTLLNYVSSHPEFEPRFEGAGPLLTPLEWDVKAYFTLAGAMHDAAICAWGAKGAYDYIRPISALRGMAERGQSSDPNLASYDPLGITLRPGYIELVELGDSLAGPNDENLGKIKLKAWKGPDHIADPETDIAGVGWILADHWWPYQRPTFITPPFAGYISGHSTFSRAAAEVMTRLTGDAYFPGGMGEFFAAKNEFLVFEEGPSMDLTLQWATYRDASDQTSLSRIWGGIHPPADDIPGRILGIEVGERAFEMAASYFDGVAESEPLPTETVIFPNPARGDSQVSVYLQRPTERAKVEVFDSSGRLRMAEEWATHGREFLAVPVDKLESGVYFLHLTGDDWSSDSKINIVR